MDLMRRIVDMARQHIMASMIMTLAASVLLVMIVMPEGRASRDREIQRDLEAGRVAEIAESPDGAKVWAVEREGKTIYFSKGSLAVEAEPTPAS